MSVQTPQRSPDPSPGTDVGAGVVEDARARQQRHRRAGGWAAAALIAGVAALILASGGGGHRRTGAQASGGSAPVPVSARHESNDVPAVSAEPVAVAKMGLLAPGVGWVAYGERLYLTRNSGRTWKELRTRALPDHATVDVTPSTPSSRTLMVSAVDAESVYAPCAAAATSQTHGSALAVGSTLLSTDAGRTWRPTALPRCLTPASLGFVNAKDGFTFGHFDHHGFPTPAIYRTTDAGRQWIRVGRPPFEGSVSFATARDGLGGGWGLGDGPSDSAGIYRTSNGGHTWTPTSLCQPATEFDCEAPSLFRSGRGVVAVTVYSERSPSGEVAVYTTRNNGISWSPHILPNTPKSLERPEWIPFSAPNANDLFAWISPYLYRSTDGGVTWSRSIERTLAGQPGLASTEQELSNIDFISANYGWYDDAGTFEYTTDAGRHWTAIHTLSSR